MKKMVVSSFYNTLIDEEDAIPTSLMIEIDKIPSQGILFTIGTNRTYQEILEYNKDFPFVDYIISLNGSYVYDVKKGKCLSKRKLANSILQKISTTFVNKKVWYYGEKDIYTELDSEKKDIYKVEIEISNSEEWEKVKKWKVEPSVFQKDGKQFLEIISCNNNMFHGVDLISLKNNIKLEDVIAIGCNECDESILKNLQNSFIVNNACELLQKYKTKKIPYNHAKGVEYLLKKLYVE